MQPLLLTLGLGLVAALRAQDPLAFPQEEPDVSGQWYLKAMVTDRVSEKKPESVTPLTVTALDGGDLELKTATLTDGQCQELKVVLEKTDEPGKYSAYGGRRVVHLQKAWAQGHYIVYCEGELDGEQVRMGKLLGRDPENNPEALGEFREVMEGRGLDPESIFLPEQTEICTPRDS